MRPSHPAGVVAMRKAPLDQRASLPEQALAIGPVHPLPVGVDGPLLLLLALPVPLRMFFYVRWGAPWVVSLQGDRQYRSGLQINSMFGFVRQMRPPILHLGNARVRIMRIHPLLVAGLLLPLAI